MTKENEEIVKKKRITNKSNLQRPVFGPLIAD
jgi:hypothetical protein